MYYEDYLNSLKPSNVIPESATLNDMDVFVDRSFQDAYNEVAISLACQEMAVFESVMLNEADGEEAQNSASVKKSVLDYVKEFFSKIWKAIKEFFMKLIDKIKAFFDKKRLEAMNRLMKKFNAAVEVYKKAPSEAKNDDFGYITKLDLGQKALDFSLGIPKDAQDWAQKALNYLSNNVGKENKDSTVGAEYIENNFNVKEFIDNAKGDTSIKKMIKNLLEEGGTYNGKKSSEVDGIGGDNMIRVQGKDVVSKAKDLEELVRNVRGWMDNIKKTYNESKKAIDGMMKQARKLTNINHRSVRAYCSACRKLSSYLTRCCSASNRVYKKVYSDGLKCVKKVIAGAKKWQGKSGAKNESYDYFSSFDEGFDFYLEEDDATDDSDEGEDYDLEEK